MGSGHWAADLELRPKPKYYLNLLLKEAKNNGAKADLVREDLPTTQDVVEEKK